MKIGISLWWQAFASAPMSFLAVKLVQQTGIFCSSTSFNAQGRQSTTQIGSLLGLCSFLTEPESSCNRITTTTTQHRNLGDIKLSHCQFNFPQPSPVPPTVKWIRAADQISRLYGQLRFDVLDSTMLAALGTIANSLQKYFELWFPESWVDWRTWRSHLQHRRGERSRCNYWQVVSWGWILASQPESVSWGRII